MMISKSKINAALNGVGMTVVKIIRRMPAGHSKQEVYKNLDGKMIKGIRAGSVGPLTATDAHIKQLTDVKQKLHIALEDIGMVYYPTEDEYVANVGTKKEIRLSLITSEFPMYVPGQAAADYRQQVIVPMFK